MADKSERESKRRTEPKNIEMNTVVAAVPKIQIHLHLQLRPKIQIQIEILVFVQLQASAFLFH